MITCPNCGGENADHSTHCGHCGQQLSDGGGKKTMIGMAALDASSIAKAAEEAKAAKAAREAATGGGLPGPPSLNLPKPGGAAGDDDPYAKTEMMPSVQTAALADAPGGAPAGPPPGGPASEPPAADPFADDFAALEAQYGDEPPVDPAPVGPPPSSAPTGGPPGTNNSGTPPMGQLPDPGPPLGGPPPAMAKPMTSDVAVKKNNTPIIIAAVVGVLGFMGCIGAVAIGIFMGG
jgi:hypothetical protein